MVYSVPGTPPCVRLDGRQPWTSVTVMPVTPASFSASFTSSVLNGLMMAVISFTSSLLSST